MKFIIAAVAGVGAFLIFRQLTKDVIREDVRNIGFGTHVAAGVGAILLVRLLKK